MRWKILETIIITGIIVSLIFGCNPLSVKKINCADGKGLSLEENYSKVRPYVKLEHMMLTDSGYYTVNENDDIQSRFYMGDLGAQRYFIEISQDYLDAFEDAEMMEDISLTVKLMPADAVIEAAADSEAMDPHEYQETYHISSVAASQYRNNIAGVYIYYALAILFAIGIFCQMMRNEKQKNTKERQVDYEK